MEAAAVQNPPTLPRTRKLGDRMGDGLLYGLTAAASLLSVLVVFAIVWRVAQGAWPAIKVFHLNFLWDNVWNAPLNEYGARDLIIGTIVTSFGAILLAAPLSIAIGLFLSELAPPSIRTPVGTLVDMLAAVPSVVIGLWGIYVLAPFNAQHVQPFISSILGWLPIFANGQDKIESTVFSAMIVLTIMIIPITSSICRELFIGVPEELEEGSIGLGATRWEMVKTVVVPSVRGGVVAAIMLGLGRALGEAIAVTQVIGNFIPLQRSIFEPGDTIASRLANQYQGAITNIQISALIYLGLILLVITFVTNYAAQRIVKRFEFQRARGRVMTEPALSLKATGRSRRRLIVNKLAEGAAMLAAALAVGALALVVWAVFIRGVGALNLDFFIQGPPQFGESGGGIAPAIVGTLLLVAIATVIALPFGVLTALYVSEFAPEGISRQIRLWLDVLNGFPSIVIGIFVFTLIVKAPVPVLGWGHHQSAIAGGFALSIIMLPLVARSTMEVLRLVPNHLREASYALGVSKWQTVIRVILPTCFGGILTGTTLAIARAAGETAPLLFTCAIAGQIVDWNPAHSVQSMPLTIFQYSESADPTQHEQAWATAFVLIMFVLVTSLTARVLLERSRRKLGLTR